MVKILMLLLPWLLMRLDELIVHLKERNKKGCRDEEV